MQCWLIAGVLSVGLVGEALPAQAEADAGGGVEDLLLQAELLEVSSGELDKAMEIYRRIADDEKTAEPVKARALLYLARCHRKRGELERAKKLLEDLVEKHAEERDIVRRARSFLRELTTGKAENPQFDWIGEIQRNPEVQARIQDEDLRSRNVWVG